MEKIRDLNAGEHVDRLFQAIALAQSVVHDTVGGNHPIMAALDDALKSDDWDKVMAVGRSVVALYDTGTASD